MSEAPLLYSSPKEELILIGEQTLRYARQLFQVTRQGLLPQGRILAQLTLELDSRCCSTKVFMVLPADNENPSVVVDLSEDEKRAVVVDLSQSNSSPPQRKRNTSSMETATEPPFEEARDSHKRKSSNSKHVPKRAKAVSGAALTFAKLLDCLKETLNKPLESTFSVENTEEHIRAGWNDRGFEVLCELKVRHHLLQGLVVDIAIEKFGSSGAAKIEWEAFCQRKAQQKPDWKTLKGWRTSLNQSLTYVKLARFILLLNLNWTYYRRAMRLLKVNRVFLEEHGLGPQPKRATFQELITVSEADRQEVKALLESIENL